MAEVHRKLRDGELEWSIPADVGDGPRRLFVHALVVPYAGLIDVELCYVISDSDNAEQLADGMDYRLCVDVEEAEWLLRTLPGAIAAAKAMRAEVDLAIAGGPVREMPRGTQ